ncbi:pentatricopeptide repeat-containing protein At4g16390, chloroplastic-like [Lotus japonicus]|uniref:pentatricopeptide repeat-containing protein At4g16390, chloroplastic-like n=1 Tax=Lotus japonicus TaxID=34305 RepID=UPI00258C6D93|nr:pentatricopeptide repeat-containing protein At4g16390, chloroplastic-like [Lotus japonicus]
MVSRLCSSYSSLTSFSSSSSPSSSSSSRNFKFKTVLPLNHASLQNANSHDHPVASSSSSRENQPWVNPNSPRAQLFLKRFPHEKYTLLLKLTDSLNSCDPADPQVSAILNDLGDNVSEREAVFILDRMENSETAPVVLRYLRDKIKPTRGKELVLYNVAMKVFKKCKDFEGAEKLFDEMLQRKLKPDNVTFATMINCARLCSMSDRAVEWFEKMPGFGCEPDAVTCATVIFAYARVENVDMAERLYDRAKTENWRLDTVTFSALIKMYGMLEDYDQCLNVYDDMKVLGVKPNLGTYNTLLPAVYRARKPLLAKLIYEEMKRNGISPDYITYSTLLRAYIGGYLREDALGIYREMKENRIGVTVDLCNLLLSMCADVGFLDEAVEIFEDIKSSGIYQPDESTFSSLITVYSCFAKVSEAEAMLNEMIESGFKPNIFVITPLVKCYGKVKQIDDVVKIVKRGLDWGIVPDGHCCCCLLNIMTKTPMEELGKLIDCIEKANEELGSVVRYLVEGQEEGDQDFIKETSALLNSTDAEIKKPLCNCLIDLCVYLNLPNRARELFDLGSTLEIYKDVQFRAPTQWSLHLRRLSVGAAMTALHVWINDLCKALESGEELPSLGINTGIGKYQFSDKGLASVFESHLKKLKAPFHEAPDKPGWFFISKKAAKSWLKSRGSAKSIAALDSLVLGVPTMALPY